MPNTHQSAQELYDEFMRIAVSPVLISDAIELYARQEISDEDARENFIEKYENERYLSILLKAALEAVVAVVTGLQVDNEAVFRGVIELLDMKEEDAVAAHMKRVMLNKLAEDACDDLEAEAEARLQARMAYVLARIS